MNIIIMKTKTIELSLKKTTMTQIVHGKSNLDNVAIRIKNMARVIIIIIIRNETVNIFFFIITGCIVAFTDNNNCYY